MYLAVPLWVWGDAHKEQIEILKKDWKTCAGSRVCINRQVMMRGGRAMRHQIRGNHFMIIEDVLSFKWFTRHFEMRLNWESRHRCFITVYLAKTLSSSALVCSIQGSSESINSTPLNLLSYQFTCCPLSLHLETCLALPNSASLFSVNPCLNHLSLALAVVTITERERERKGQIPLSLYILQ